MSWSRIKVVSAVIGTVLFATTTLAACGSDGDKQADTSGTSSSPRATPVPSGRARTGPTARPSGRTPTPIRARS